MGWAGIYWQYPQNNWGTKPGYPISPGAKKITFMAKGDKGGEKVTFSAGGIGTNQPYADTVNVKKDITLTTTWTAYSLDLSAQSYTSVLAGFGWTMAAPATNSTAAFSVDDIQWQE
jgi:hypothetical protein